MDILALHEKMKLLKDVDLNAPLMELSSEQIHQPNTARVSLDELPPFLSARDLRNLPNNTYPTMKYVNSGSDSQAGGNQINLETAISHGEHREHGVKTKAYEKESDHLAGETMISPNTLFSLFFPRAPRGRLLFIG